MFTYNESETIHHVESKMNEAIASLFHQDDDHEYVTSVTYDFAEFPSCRFEFHEDLLKGLRTDFLWQKQGPDPKRTRMST